MTTFKNEEDKELYEKFLKGDNESFEKIIMKYKNNLIYFIFKFVKNEEAAEDVFQDIVVYLLDKKEIYNFKYSFKTFLYTIAKSRALNYIRSEKVKESYIANEEKTYIVEEKLLEDIIFSRERQEKIRNVINKMSDEYQMVTYLAIIEDLPYEEVGKIMDKNMTQIKNLLHRARVKLRKLLIQERVVEMKENKAIRFLVWALIIGIVTTGAAYAANSMYKNYVKNNTNHHVTMNPTYQSTLDENTINNIWVGTLDLAWKDLTEKVGKRIELDEDLEIVKELNESTFSKEMLDSKDYEINVERTVTNGYKIDATLNKELNFLEVFDNFSHDYTNWRFGDGEEYIKYFGINNASSEKMNKNVEILFYNTNTENELSNDFAVKLKTKEGDEIILYRTDDKKSFNEYYNDIKTKADNYTKPREFSEEDELRIPYVRVNGMIVYDELFDREIKDSKGLYIYDVIQNVNFSLNEKGCNLSSKATMVTEYMGIGMETRYCYFTDTFIIFMKEADSDNPYFALKVDNSDVLEKIEETDEPKITDYTVMADSDRYTVAEGEYKFFEDENYEYYYTSQKTKLVNVFFKDGTYMTAEEALKERKNKHGIVR